MASRVFNGGADGLTGGSISWTADTIKARLVTASGTPDVDLMAMTTLTGVGTDQTLGSKARTKEVTSDRIKYAAGNPTFPAVPSGSTVYWCIVYKFVTTDADSIPIAYLDVTDTPTNGGDITIAFNSDGVFYLQQ